MVLREVDVVYKNNSNHKGNIVVNNSNSLADAFRAIFPIEIDTREAFIAMYFDVSNNPIGWKTIALGGISSCHVEPGLLYQQYYVLGASAIAVAHNHPGSSLWPSKEDDCLTEKIKKQCNLLDIRLLDHIIITEKSHYSYIDNCKL